MAEEEERSERLLEELRYVKRLCNELALHGKVEKVAHKILKAAGKLRLTSGRGPNDVAAAASYMASTVMGERRTQREVAEAARITEITIRNRYREMMKRLLIVISL